MLEDLLSATKRLVDEDLDNLQVNVFCCSKTATK